MRKLNLGICIVFILLTHNIATFTFRIIHITQYSMMLEQFDLLSKNIGKNIIEGQSRAF